MKHRLAMVGFGGMANWHYDLIQRIEDLEVAGIWDIKEERREYAQEKGVHVYQSLEDLLADETVDLVLAATPNDVHKEIAVRAMEAGKNVVSRKTGDSLFCGSCSNAGSIRTYWKNFSQYIRTDGGMKTFLP